MTTGMDVSARRGWLFMSKAELANQADMSTTTVTSIERDQHVGEGSRTKVLSALDLAEQEFARRYGRRAGQEASLLLSSISHEELQRRREAIWLARHELAAAAGLRPEHLKGVEEGSVTNPHSVLSVLAAIERIESKLRSPRPEDEGRLMSELLNYDLYLRLKQHRYMTGLSVQRLATDAGVSVNVWERAEGGGHVGQSSLHKIALALVAALKE